MNIRQKTYQTEQELWHAFLSSDKDAFACLFEKYADAMYAYGRKMTPDAELVKDAIQDVFVKLYLNRRNLSEVRNLKYYLFRSLKNNLLDMLKVSVDTCSIDDYQYKFTIKWNILNELIAEEDKKEIEGKLNKLLSSLTGRQREIIYLRFIHELEYEEIASLMHMTIQSSRKAVSRAIGKMRKLKVAFLFIIICLW